MHYKHDLDRLSNDLSGSTEEYNKKKLTVEFQACKVTIFKFYTCICFNIYISIFKAKAHLYPCTAFICVYIKALWVMVKNQICTCSQCLCSQHGFQIHV